jgi:hypothetical protein
VTVSVVCSLLWVCLQGWMAFFWRTRLDIINYNEHKSWQR